MFIGRVVALLLVVIAAVVGFFVLAPATAAPGTDFSSQRSSVESGFAATNADAQYIYGQIYAAGVAGKDATEVVSSQLDAISAQAASNADAQSKGGERIAFEAMMIVLAVAIIGVTTPRIRTLTQSAEGSVPPPPVYTQEWPVSPPGTPPAL